MGVGRVFIRTFVHMSKARTIGAGAIVRRQNGGGGAATSINQGGGDKLIGLVSTKNRAIKGATVNAIRTRAGGGNSRHWIFCMNQLGGVGRHRWQASGPGNRGGVHESCQALARESRINYPLGWHTYGPRLSSASQCTQALNAWVAGKGPPPARVRIALYYADDFTFAGPLVVGPVTGYPMSLVSVDLHYSDSVTLSAAGTSAASANVGPGYSGSLVNQELFADPSLGLGSGCEYNAGKIQVALYPKGSRWEVFVNAGTNPCNVCGTPSCPSPTPAPVLIGSPQSVTSARAVYGSPFHGRELTPSNNVFQNDAMDTGSLRGSVDILGCAM